MSISAWIQKLCQREKCQNRIRKFRKFQVKKLSSITDPEDPSHESGTNSSQVEFLKSSILEEFVKHVSKLCQSCMNSSTLLSIEVRDLLISYLMPFVDGYRHDVREEGVEGPRRVLEEVVR